MRPIITLTELVASAYVYARTVEEVRVIQRVAWHLRGAEQRRRLRELEALLDQITHVMLLDLSPLTAGAPDPFG